MIAIGFWLAVFLGGTAIAVLPDQFEISFSEAVLAYHQNQTQSAMEILDKILKADPSCQECLEFRALCLVAENRFLEAKETYTKLLDLVPPNSTLPNNRLTYEFELGRVCFEIKDHDCAFDHLNVAYSAGFRTTEAQFLVAMAAYYKKDRAKAKAQLLEVIHSKETSLQVAANAYLAIIAKTEGTKEEKAQYLSNLKALAFKQTSDPSEPEGSVLTKEMLAAIESQMNDSADEIHPLSLSVGFFGGYDSNPLLYSQPISTADFSLHWKLTHISSPLKAWQAYTTYRGDFNYITNSYAHTAEFFNHDLSIFLTKNAASLSNFGFKLQGIGSFRYQYPDGDQGKFMAYSLIGSLGPYLQYEFIKDWTLSVDTFFEPQKFYADLSATPENHLSGMGGLFRVSVTRESKTPYWNPVMSFSTNLNETTGTEFRSRALNLNFGNTYFINDKYFAASTLGAGAGLYPFRPGGSRQDGILRIGLAGGYHITKEATALLAFTYFINSSNVEIYVSKRLIATLGANYYF